MEKTKFNAQQGTTQSTQDVWQNPQKYSFVHNFKVHYKRGLLQALANKLDVSISSSSPQLPSTQQVVDEFNKRMTATVVVSDTRHRYSEASFHITNVEYKESFAFASPSISYQAQQPQQSVFCRNCGNKLLPDSRFCNKCGAPISQ